MQFLELISKDNSSSWYKVSGDYQGAVQRWVVSTPETRQVFNDSSVLGLDFTERLFSAMTAALSTAPFRGFLESVPSQRLCVVNFLRGSLNFETRRALGAALGSQRHTTCFLSSQRYREEGRWHVKENMYRKMDVQRGSILVFSDVVATGVTVDSGLEVIVEHLLRHESNPKGLVFFTIGCHKLEKVLDKYDGKLRELIPGYEETHIVYFEGKMKLVDSNTKLLIKIPGTDLVRRDALMSPELELSQFDSITARLERCVIYDAGSRAFDTAEYVEDVVGYWQQLRGLAHRGYTLREALLERWPEPGYGSRQELAETRQVIWPWVDNETLDRLWESRSRFWANPPHPAGWCSSEALEEVCNSVLRNLT